MNDRGTFTIGDPPIVLKNAFSEAFGYVNLSAALTVSSDVYFYELGSRFCPGRVPHVDPGDGQGAGPGRLHRDRAPLRGQRADPRRADQAPPPRLQPRRLPRPRVVHGRQPQPGHRPGRHRGDAAPAGQRLRHPGQRRHRLRPPRGRVDPRRQRRRGAHGRAPGQPQDDDPARDPRPAGRRLRGGGGRHPGARPRPPSPASRSTGSRSRARPAPPRWRASRTPPCSPPSPPPTTPGTRSPW